MVSATRYFVFFTPGCILGARLMPSVEVSAPSKMHHLAATR